MMEFAAFKNPFKNPTTRDLAIEWALRDVDTNKDGKISLDEFLSDYLTKPTDNLEFYGEDFVDIEKHRFNDDFDRDGNGFLEGEELGYWIGPDNTEIAIEETGKN
jgi:Ca2+-binding EF-hand superfamily protein